MTLARTKDGPTHLLRPCKRSSPSTPGDSVCTSHYNLFGHHHNRPCLSSQSLRRGNKRPSGKFLSRTFFRRSGWSGTPAHSTQTQGRSPASQGSSIDRTCPNKSGLSLCGNWRSSRREDTTRRTRGTATASSASLLFPKSLQEALLPALRLRRVRVVVSTHPSSPATQTARGGGSGRRWAREAVPATHPVPALSQWFRRAVPRNVNRCTRAYQRIVKLLLLHFGELLERCVSACRGRNGSILVRQSPKAKCAHMRCNDTHRARSSRRSAT